jgi:hypothetical protein
MKERSKGSIIERSVTERKEFKRSSWSERKIEKTPQNHKIKK